MKKITIENVTIILNEECEGKCYSTLIIGDKTIIKLSGKMTAEEFFNFLFDRRLMR